MLARGSALHKIAVACLRAHDDGNFKRVGESLQRLRALLARIP
jgi:hypothetical protein